MSFAADSSVTRAEASPRPRGALGRLMSEPMGATGAVLVALFILLALFAPLIAPYDPLALDIPAKLQGPSLAHLAGTDQLGRDTLSRLIYGARTALAIALGATGAAGVIGLALGMAAGYGPRWLDGALMLILDSLASLPMIMFALAVITVLGPSAATLVFVIILVSISGYARLVRAQTLGLKNAEFIQAERTMGASTFRILFRHIMPNVVGPLLIILSMDVPVVIMLEAGLSYLNLGIRPPTPSWGNILYDGYSSLRQQPALVIAAGVPLVLSTIGFTFLGEGLRDALDPRLKG